MPLVYVKGVGVSGGNIVDIGVHNAVQRIMAQPAKAEVFLGIGLCKAEHILHKQSRSVSVQQIAEGGHILCAERVIFAVVVKNVRTITAKNKGLIVPWLVVCYFKSTLCVVFVCVAVRHNLPLK